MEDTDAEAKILREDGRDAEANGDDDDYRLEFISSYLSKSLRLKPDKWMKMLANDEYKAMVVAFLDNAAHKKLIMHVSAAGLLTPCLEVSAAMSGRKSAFFARRIDTSITNLNYRAVLTCGDLPSKPLLALAVLLDNVIMPMVTNPSNCPNIAPCVRDDVKRHINHLGNVLGHVNSASVGVVALPMPDHVEQVFAELQVARDSGSVEYNNGAFKSAIEEAVSKWAAIVASLLKSQPEHVFEHGRDNATPNVEMDFWQRRLTNMESIYAQLCADNVKAMQLLLQSTHSTCERYLHDVLRKVVAAVIECRDITTHLRPLRRHFDGIEQREFLCNAPHLRPMIHCVFVMWTRCKHYRSKARVTVLVREIGNLLIEQCVKQLEPSSILQGDVDENYKRVTEALNIFHLYRHHLRNYQLNVREYITAEAQQTHAHDTYTLPSVVLRRVNDFEARLQLIARFFATIADFSSLEKIEIGGLKGRYLSVGVGHVLDEFVKLHQNFVTASYDALDVHDHGFVRDYRVFSRRIHHLDVQLASLFTQAIDDCSNLESAFKLLNIIGVLLERPIVRREVAQRFERLVHWIDDDLDAVKVMFDEGVGDVSRVRDILFPPVAGVLTWLNKLRTRITQPVEQFQLLQHAVTQSPQVAYMLRKHAQMLQYLNEHEALVLGQWSQSMPNIIRTHMRESLLTRDGQLLRVNFHHELTDALREMRYMRMLERDLPLPLEALELFERGEQLFAYTQRLTRVCEWYNFLRSDTRHVERALILDEMHEIDARVDALIDTYAWTDHASDAIETLYDSIVRLKTRVMRAQTNIGEFFDEMNSWAGQYMFDRVDCDAQKLFDVESREQCVNARMLVIQQTFAKLDDILRENYRLYFDVNDEPVAEPVADNVQDQPLSNVASKASTSTSTKASSKGKKSPGKSARKRSKSRKREAQRIEAERIRSQANARASKWHDYLTYIDEQVSRRMIQACVRSLSFFVDEMDVRAARCPLFEITVDLRERDLVYTPSLDVNDDSCNGFYMLMQQLIDDISGQCAAVKRVVVGDNVHATNYSDELKQNDNNYTQMIRVTLERARDVCARMHEHTAEIMQYSELWLRDRQLFLHDFLRYGRYVDEDKLPAACPPGECKPTMDQFKEQIDMYEELYNEVETMQAEKTFDAWMRLNMHVLRVTLLNLIRKWGNLFKDHLINYVKDSLQELEDFMGEVNREIQVEVNDGDYDTLVRVMNLLKQVRNRADATDEMFEPIGDCIDMLRAYAVDFSDDVHLQLQELPNKWLATKRVVAVVKQQLAPLQAKQVALIKKRLQLFDIVQRQFRHEFGNRAFLQQFNCARVYDVMDACNDEIAALETRLEAIVETCVLFEVAIPSFPQIVACRRELKLAKHVWDYIHIVHSCIEQWKKTPWMAIDVEAMEMECKRQAKEMRQMDKDVREWTIYAQLEAGVKNMLTSLRAVTELQNPAIKERHWMQLMRETQVTFSMDSATTLADLLALELHKYEDEVKMIVDKSIKEMAMEKVLAELQATWSAMEFDYETHERTRTKLMRITEELIEVLEENQVQLQNIITSKYVDHFLTELTQWQRKLSNADQVIGIWQDVHRKWNYLEAIFVGSEDIRRQLPDDSRRFDRADKQFRLDIVAQVNRSANVIESCNIDGLYDRLEVLLNDLMVCEKALNDYLETKRLIYPRFYFISSADLLDILSNGNMPQLVAKHLIKLYDSLARLTFDKKEDRHARTMIAKDGEVVELRGRGADTCDCSGKVEVWLNRVTDAMRSTLHAYFGDALRTYESKARERWIFDWPAQVALVGSQIWWTSEVNVAFSRLEQGHEAALKDYHKKQVNQLSALITLLLGDLSSADRQKIMTICTIDVHSRDVVFKMVQAKTDSSSSFQWQSQLRHRWDDTVNNCFGNICDAQLQYQYEYLGCTPRLVITPLTDRCYITLTQSLHLIMGGAPAGPAGTGKTETTKDLGRALGVMVYVFNCSEQMDYKSCGNIYKGLAQTGAWGCFDEFNRISIEVLSVVAVQVKTVLDAIKNKKRRFVFLGEEINLTATVGMFITMNPGYAGRTELPENLKALFRPCAMVVPDFELICEIMLVAEGFQDARLLARKFITLYTLCRELLSKQDHYDWGLRAIKSVLVVAGSLKRSDRTRAEDQVLMRALRDFNIPKIVTDDLPVFMGLIGDLFPALDVPRKRDFEFEKIVRKSALDLHLQADENFVLKVVQLEELFAVRHSVFIVGHAGTGKSQVWKTLNKTYANQKRKPIYADLNPKAVTNDELFGIINPATREWKDGLFSVIMRDQANLSGTSPKWIVLDGDIDPMWIESLNTVMDDNKVLTLASNERIALTEHMRLLFEISNLSTATPATVSRAGILYINAKDFGWNPFVTSWIEQRAQSEHSTLIVLFEKYVPACIEQLDKLKKITPIATIAHVQMLCYLLDCLLIASNLPPDSAPNECYEIFFVFACVWAFGSALFQDQIIDWRNEFHKWWVNEFKTIKFPTIKDTNIFSYYIDRQTYKFRLWNDIVKPFDLDVDVPLQALLVDTQETARYRFFMDMLIEHRRPIMLVGGAGSGKSVIISAKLSTLPETFSVTNVAFNFYTSSDMLQRVLEKPLEKKAGRNYGPPGSKRIIYFVDDMNMPEVDTYGTVQPHTLMRQFLDYRHWYDRTKLTVKDINNIQFVSSMNPSAGSFTINPRLQRHFCVFAVSFPNTDACIRIYNSILSQHLANPAMKFAGDCLNVCRQLVTASVAFHQKLAQTLLPTAVKFHYIFNLRDLSNVYQAMLFANGECVRSGSELVRLYMHEAARVYGDKLVHSDDLDTFKRLLHDIIKKNVEELDDAIISHEPNIYCHFAESVGDAKYMFVHHGWPQLQKQLDETLSSYNDLVGAMNLVLFEDAIHHVCRINRILEAPRGNALLIGVGGSGKQSLARLSAFISSYEVFQMQLRKGYGIADLKSDFATLYHKTGVKSIGTMFLMNDSQVADERFLVVINDMLASGEIAELFADDEIENIVNAMRNEVKSAGLLDTKDNCWKFFINRVRRQLKMVLCFSPVGSTLRVRARKFPAIVNCTAIDWFHEWPQNALESVSRRFLSEMPALAGTPLVEPIAKFMSYVHVVVNDMSQLYLSNERRYNYTTPKSFLEQIALYDKLLREHVRDVDDHIERLHNGLEKLRVTAIEVDTLKETLKEQEIEVTAKNRAAEQLIGVLKAESDKVALEQEIAADEEKKVKVIEEDVTIKAKICADDLAKAEPALIAAEHALNTLNKNNLTELKSFGSPPDAVVDVCSAVLVLMSPKGKVPRDRSWKAAKIMMGKVDQFLSDLKNYDKENIHPDVVKAIQPYINNRNFEPTFIRTKSSAAGGLCEWVINIMKFYDVYVVVEPKRRALDRANQELNDARTRLHELNDKLHLLEQQLHKLQTEFDTALAAKQKVQAEADATARTIDLANRLVNGLASENIRWRETVVRLKARSVTLPGDILVVTAFISYVGCFTKPYRVQLMTKHWLPFLNELEPTIARTPAADPLSLLIDDAQVATWNNDGLPNDAMSTENATILTHSARWPLMIDPQLQGVKWIKRMYKDLVVVRLTTRNYLDVLERAICNGDVVLIENIDESVDAVLDPVLGRQLIKKGRVMRIGDKEIDYDPRFRLILHTKLANPHYKPEMQAQTTLINFTVTRDGLEEQLLAEVVKAERPDLEQLKAQLTTQQNHFKITVKTCEDNLLFRLSSATGNILEDVDLVENLETIKKMAAEISVKVAEAKVTAVKIDEAREIYRPAANRASLLYFILNDLNKINSVYQFSLKAFSVVFNTAIVSANPSNNIAERVSNLLHNITLSIFAYTSRGLFECDKLIFTLHMALQIVTTSDANINPLEVDFLLRCPTMSASVASPVAFLTNHLWAGVRYLATIDEFENLDKDILGATKRWQKYVESESPENERLPQEWKNKSALQRLCMLRTLRPDRMIYAARKFIEEKLGAEYVTARSIPFGKSFDESSPTTPIFFILSAGVDPLKDVEKLGLKLGFSVDNKNLHNVSLGQGQEEVAERAMEVASRHGHWIILQNIHLVAKWLPSLEKKMEQCMDGAHANYRLFVSAEPAPSAEFHIIPQGILESSIKITNEPPTGMLANLHKALDNFSQETLEMCTKEAEFKGILFSLCYFHAVVAERRKFGAQGWNRIYPFNVGDLTISVYVLYNYLENNLKVPWEDLRYLFGEIMYGGHITDDWDRRLCRTFLTEYMQPDLIDGDLWLAPAFKAPPNLDYIGYHQYVDDMLPNETPYLYGLHLNAEIGFLTDTSHALFRAVFELQPRDSAASTHTVSNEDKIKSTLEDIYDKLPELYNMSELMTKTEEKTPFVLVALQECERMNMLVKEMKTTLRELELGLKGELTITKNMEDLQECLLFDKIPPNWERRAYPSTLALGAWFGDLIVRMRELEMWVNDFTLPPTVWMSGFFNPQSFLTAIMQQTARKNEWPLDKMCLSCDVTAKQREQFTLAPREGACVHGLYMEGARWDIKTNSIVDSNLGELFPAMPVIYLKAVTQDKQELKNMYECPVYKTRQRGPTFVWTFNLKTKDKPAKWTMAGVALILQI